MLSPQNVQHMHELRRFHVILIAHSCDQARVQSEANQQRVSFRQAEIAHREQLKLEKALLLQQQQQDREDRLDRLRAQVCVLPECIQNFRHFV